MAKNLLTNNFSEPLNQAKAAIFDIQAGDGNLTIDSLSGDEAVLASGALQYFEKQSQPIQSRVSNGDQAKLTLRGSSAGQTWFHLPWSTCNGATEWQIHLNPTVCAEITAHSDGGNVRLDLAGMAVRRVSADTGGGNMDVVLPDEVANLSVTAKTGAGNVTVDIGNGTQGSNMIHANSGAGSVIVHIPSGMAARIQANSGMGKTSVDPVFIKIGKDIYQSPNFDSAANKVEITANSGAGNVSVSMKQTPGDG